MKNKLKAMGLLLCFATSAMMASCTKDNDENFSLVGKTYAATSYVDHPTGGGQPYTIYFVIRFTSERTTEHAARKNGVHGSLIGDINNGTYTLNYPNIHIEYEDAGHRVIDGVFIDETCFRRNDTGSEYVLQ